MICRAIEVMLVRLCVDPVDGVDAKAEDKGSPSSIPQSYSPTGLTLRGSETPLKPRYLG